MTIKTNRFFLKKKNVNLNVFFINIFEREHERTQFLSERSEH